MPSAMVLLAQTTWKGGIKEKHVNILWYEKLKDIFSSYSVFGKIIFIAYNQVLITGESSIFIVKALVLTCKCVSIWQGH